MADDNLVMVKEGEREETGQDVRNIEEEKIETTEEPQEGESVKEDVVEIGTSKEEETEGVEDIQKDMLELETDTDQEMKIEEHAVTETQQDSTISTEQTSTEQISTEQTSTEQTSTEQTSTEQTSTEQISTEQTSTEQTSTEQTSTEQTSTEQTSTEQTSTEQTSTEQTSTEQISTEQTSTEQTSTEQTSTEQTSTEQISTEQTSTEQISTEQISTDKHSEETSTDKHSEETSTDKHSEETSTDKHSEETSTDKHSEETSTDKHSEETSTDKHSEETSTDKHSEETSTDRHSEETSTDKHSEETSTDKHSEETSTDKHSEETSTDKHSEETSTDKHSEETSTDKHSKETSTDKHSEETSTDKHSKEASTDKHSKETSTDKHSKEASTDKHSKETSTDKHSEETSTDKHSKEASTDKHSEETSTDKHSKEASTDKHSEETSTDKHSEETSTDKHSEETSTDRHSEETSTDKHSEETSTDKHSEETSTDRHSEETSTDKHSEETFTDKHSEETSTDKHSEETSTDRHSEETSTDKPFDKDVFVKELVQDKEEPVAVSDPLNEKPQTEEIKSIIETAKPGEAFEDNTKPLLPLSLHWCYGCNASVPVYNISTDNRKMIFYSCNHIGVIYDTIQHKQYLLQGHGNPIVCITASADRRWLVTADVGNDPLLIIWDAYSGVPVRTFYDGLGQGTVGVALSHDSRYLATLGIKTPQVLSIWDWTEERETPLHSISISVDHGMQSYVTFCEENSSFLVTNSDDQVVFYKWDDKSIKIHSTPVSDDDFNKPVGLLSQTIYIPLSDDITCPHWAITGTSEGCFIVWETAHLYQSQEMRSLSELHLEVKKPVKLLKTHNYPITTLTKTNKYIVSGDSSGHIKFFDKDLKLLNWYDSINYGPIASLSFAYYNLQKTNESVSKYPQQCTVDIKQFILPDFTISTSTANIVHVTSNGTIVDVILQEHDSSITTLTTHPTQPLLAIGSYSCILKLWNYEIKKVITCRKFTDQHLIQCICYSLSGAYIGIGFANGKVLIVNGLCLSDESNMFHYSRDTVTHLCFSSDSSYMATADLEMVVSVYYINKSNNNWTFLARHKPHYKLIEALTFGVSPDSGNTRLLSLSQDRTLVEYDLQNSSTDDLKLLSVDRIEQSAVPTAIAWYPSLTVESFIVTANDQYKLKLYNSVTKMCRKTLLGPTFGTPIKKMAILPGNVRYSEFGEEIRRYLIYTTVDKVGMLLLPHDGNPHNTVCVTAHPGSITDMSISHDGKYIFTAGGNDFTVNQWTVNTDALEAAALLGGRGLEPFYQLIEGGRSGQLYSELEEYFYYSQIKCQGIDSTVERELSNCIDIDYIPSVMRAIGYYPSEQEIENMINEVKFNDYIETGEFVTQIDLGQFIQLYINHRPVFGLAPSQIKEAFKLLGKRENTEIGYFIEKNKLLELLQKKGEHLTEAELIENLITLIGGCVNPEIDGKYIAEPNVIISEHVPDFITVKNFAEDILGLATD